MNDKKRRLARLERTENIEEYELVVVVSWGDEERPESDGHVIILTWDENRPPSAVPTSVATQLLSWED